MGGWISVGVAKFYRERLPSLVIGGWDLVDGLKSVRPAGSDRAINFDQLMTWATAATPQLVEWVTPEVRPGLIACFDDLGELSGAGDAVLNVGCPTMLWDGQEDPYHNPMKAFAGSHFLAFLSVPGGHSEALTTRGAESTRGLSAFLQASFG